MCHTSGGPSKSMMMSMVSSCENVIFLHNGTAIEFKMVPDLTFQTFT